MESKEMVTPENIMKIGMGFLASKVLLTAVEHDLFTLLAEKSSLSHSELKKHFGFKCTDRHFYDFLDTLCAFGFLRREGLLDSAKYSNSRDTDQFLDKRKPSYVGGILSMANTRLYPFWGNLGEGLRTGLPQNEIKTDGTGLFEKLYNNPVKLEEFVNAMTGAQVGNFMTFAQTFDFSKYKTLADVGGCGAMLSAMVAKHQPHMKCINFDLPPVEPLAKKSIQRFEVSDRVSTVQGDFFKDALPKADVVVMGNILHDWDEPTKMMLIKKAYEALPVGGAFVAIENIIDNDRSKNVFGLLMSLNMLIETGKGFDYTFNDFEKWAKAAGFKSTALIPLAGPASAAVAYK